jgi:homoserine/homoserine lactone efflux protein
MAGFFAACWVISLSPGLAPLRRCPAACNTVSGVGTGMRWACNGAGAADCDCRRRCGRDSYGIGDAFYAIKWFGVAYLVYLAIKQWRALPRT